MQIHGKEADPFFAEDLDAARALVGSTEDATVPLPGRGAPLRRLLAADYDPDAAAILTEGFDSRSV